MSRIHRWPLSPVLAAVLSACTAPDKMVGDTDETPVHTGDTDGDTAGDDTATPDFSSVQRIVLVTLDTLRADRMGSERMPFLAGMEAEGVVWAEAWAQTWTFAGMGTAITGRNPATWGSESFAGRGAELPALSADVPTLAEVLSARGWEAGYWASNLVGIATGLDRGYDSVNTMGVRESDWPKNVSAWLGDTAGQRQLLHIHMNDVHDPYNVWGESCAAEMSELPLETCRYDLLEETDNGLTKAMEDMLVGAFSESSEDFAACASMVTQLYDCEVVALDAALQRVFGRLEEDGYLEDALVVIAPDHGEGLFDPNPNHGVDLRAPITRSRVILWAPRRLAPEVVEVRLGLDDILPTIDALLDLGLEMETTGLPYWEVPADRVVSGYNFARPDVGRPGETHYAVNDTWHYISGSDGVEQLYDYRTDPGELDNLAGRVDIPADLAAAVAAQREITAGYLEDQ
jgi:arylsulfatase A-like enzyme